MHFFSVWLCFISILLIETDFVRGDNLRRITSFLFLLKLFIFSEIKIAINKNIKDKCFFIKMLFMINFS